MKAKYYLASLSLVGLFAACSNEEFVSEQPSNAFQGRTTVNLTLTGDADTRLSQSGTGVTFDKNDKLGAVIVDPTTLFTVADNVAIGNNKWAWNETRGAFVTEGTTAVGSWVFYSQYNPAVTTNRGGGLIYSFKQIQEGDATSKASTAAGVDFFVSPVIQLDGYEGENINIRVRTRSINARAFINAKFDAALGVTEVQKIIVKQETGKFIVKGKITNTALPVADIRATTLAGTHKSADETIQEAADKLGNRDAYPSSNITAITEARGLGSDEEETYLALDCINHETGEAMPVENNEFKTQMLIPAGTYSELDLYIYTNKGIFKKAIKKAVPDAPDAEEPIADFHLRRGFYVNLGNMRLTQTVNDDDFTTANLMITATEAIDNSTADSETNGTVVLKTSDLVEAIKGITYNGNVNINVISDDSHQTIINKDVMDAIKTKKTEKPNLQIIFSKAMEIYGEESAEAPLVLQDITFGKGAKLVSGYAKIMEDINIPALQDLEVASGASLEFAASANTLNSYSYTGLKNYGDVVISANVAIKAIRPNGGTIVIDEGASLTNASQVSNNGTITNNGTWTANSTWKNTATVNNNGTLKIDGASEASNSGTINNQGDIELTTTGTTTNSGVINNGVDGDSTKAGNIEVKNTFGNSGEIYNFVGSVLLVNATGTGALNNAVNATITNYGDLYCHGGDNTINNLGLIEAKSGATTYITTNSSDTETNGTADVDMGEIKLSGRKDDVSVTTGDQKGYITWEVPANVTEIAKVAGDKFNKVVLSAPTTIKADAYARFVVANAGTTELTLEKNIQELTFNTNSTIWAAEGEDLKVASLNVAANVRVKVPTENVIGVYEVDNDTSKTVAAIDNKGTILVGGNLWSSLSQPTTGTFASGDGNTTAFHWSKNASDYEAAY